MTATNSVTSSVEVATDPHTAFTVFTEELDCWWIQGPINFFDSARAYTKRIEPGVGGRIVEVYDTATGDGLEVARITVWDPGSGSPGRARRTTSQIDVSVQRERAGHRSCSVQATIPEDGTDRGGTSWVRMTPVWFGDWITKRDHVPHEPLRLARLAIGIHYTKPATAARWLRDVFGLEPGRKHPRGGHRRRPHVDRVSRRPLRADGVRASQATRSRRAGDAHALGFRRRPRCALRPCQSRRRAHRP